MNKDTWKSWLPFKFNRERNQGDKALAKRPETLGFPWDAFLRDPFAMLRSDDGWFGDFSASFKPVVDVVDDGKGMRVTAELPGMTKDDVEVHVDNGRLVISGEKKIENTQNEEGVYRVERSWGSFSRTIPLPQGLDVKNPKASFKDGVLSVSLAKVEAPEQPTPTKVAIT